MINYLKILLILASLFFTLKALARPEYAARDSINCIQCHVSPWGGGARRSYGKVYGARDLSTAAHLEDDWYYLDSRFLMTFGSGGSKGKEAAAPSSGGHSGGSKKNGLMTNQVYLKKEFLEDYTAAFNYDLGSFAPGLREAYVMLKQDSYSVMGGQFYLPFGLLTDEHRTYTKMLSATGIRDYDKGVILSKSFEDKYNLDVGILQGFNSLNQQSSDGGFILNFRYLPEDFPLLAGVSYVQHLSQKFNPAALSLYGVYIFDDYFKGSLSLEYVMAKGFNDARVNARYIPRLVPHHLQQTYGEEVADKVAGAAYMEFRYEVHPQVILLYKFDYLVLDQSKPENVMTRNGLGLRYQPFHSFYLLAKYEFNHVTLPAYATGGEYTVTESSGPILMFRGWF